MDKKIEAGGASIIQTISDCVTGAPSMIHAPTHTLSSMADSRTLGVRVVTGIYSKHPRGLFLVSDVAELMR